MPRVSTIATMTVDSFRQRFFSQRSTLRDYSSLAAASHIGDSRCSFDDSPRRFLLSAECLIPIPHAPDVRRDVGHVVQAAGQQQPGEGHLGLPQGDLGPDRGQG